MINETDITRWNEVIAIDDAVSPNQREHITSLLNSISDDPVGQQLINLIQKKLDIKPLNEKMKLIVTIDDEGASSSSYFEGTIYLSLEDEIQYLTGDTPEKVKINQRPKEIDIIHEIGHFLYDSYLKKELHKEILALSSRLSGFIKGIKNSLGTSESHLHIELTYLEKLMGLHFISSIPLSLKFNPGLDIFMDELDEILLTSLSDINNQANRVHQLISPSNTQAHTHINAFLNALNAIDPIAIKNEYKKALLMNEDFPEDLVDKYIESKYPEISKREHYLNSSEMVSYHDVSPHKIADLNRHHIDNFETNYSSLSHLIDAIHQLNEPNEDAQNQISSILQSLSEKEKAYVTSLGQFILTPDFSIVEDVKNNDSVYKLEGNIAGVPIDTIIPSNKNLTKTILR